MSSSTASTRQPPAGGPGGAPRPEGLLRELRLGERGAFVRYFQALRSPVYDFARRLLGSEEEAVDATTVAFVAAFRRVVLDEDVADLWVLTLRSAFEACIDRAGTPGMGPAAEPAGPSGAPRPSRSGSSDAGRRFEGALGALSIRRRAALLLHDMHGLGLAQMAAVFAISGEAAGALLFRAREDFRQAFDERSAGSRVGTCRQAEQAAAGAVGLGLGGDALRRLRRHATYCKPCRVLMETWGGGPVGLAMLLEPWPLPQALATPPVFGGIAEPGFPTAVAAASVLGRGLRSLGGLLRGRAAAYAVAAACVALAAGLALHDGGTRTLFVAESVGPAIRLVVRPPADVSRPRQHAGTSGSQRPSPAASQSASAGLVSSSPVQTGEPAVAASSGRGAAGSRARGAGTSTEKGAVAVAAASTATTDARASQAARRAAAQRRHDATRHTGTKSWGARHGASRRHGHRARPDRSAHGRGHRASWHGAHGTGHHGRSHVSGRPSRAVHQGVSGEHRGRRHAKKNH